MRVLKSEQPDFAMYLRRYCVYIDVVACQKLTGVVHVVNAGRYKIDLRKSCGSEFGTVVAFF
jgi:hypothetical protein